MFMLPLKFLVSNQTFMLALFNLLTALSTSSGEFVFMESVSIDESVRFLLSSRLAEQERSNAIWPAWLETAPSQTIL